MKRSLTFTGMILICLLCIFTAMTAWADDAEVSGEDGAIFVPAPSERYAGTISVNSLQFYDSNGNENSFSSAFAGLQVNYAIQTGSVDQNDWSISSDGEELVSFSIQRGDPYFVTSNLFDDEIYMIYSADHFVEPLVSALNDVLKRLSGKDELIPMSAVEKITEFMNRFREKSDSGNSASTLDLLKNAVSLDWSAFSEAFEDISTRMEDQEPVQIANYFYTNIADSGLRYEWPAADSLPQFPEILSAKSAHYTGDDFLMIIDCLPQFFEDNVDLKTFVNTYLENHMQDRLPETEPSDEATTEGDPEAEEKDKVTRMIDAFREKIEEHKDEYSLDIRVSLDKNDEPVLYNFEITFPKEEGTASAVFSVLMTDDRNQKVTDYALDLNTDGENKSVFRMISVNHLSPDGTSRTNFAVREIFDMEFTATTEKTLTTPEMDFSSTNFAYTYETMEGQGTIATTNYANDFDGKDTIQDITFTLVNDGNAVLTMNLSLEQKAEDPHPEITPEQAISVADMSAEDYKKLAQTISLHLMQLFTNGL